MPEKTKAVISKSSPRYQDWMAVFETDTVPLLSPIPERASAPGIEEADFYQLDVAALDPDQRRHLAEHIARKFHLREDLVWRDLDSDHGVPILGDDLMVIA